MNHFSYIDGALHAELVPLAKIADAVGTPFYCYSTAALTGSYTAYAEALSGLDARVYYSLKANSNQAIIATLGRLGAGADVVSVGEMYRAIKAGIPAARIVFAGVGKTPAEMAAALDAGIHQFNIESKAELETLNGIALARGKRAPVALRVNPDIDAKTHAKISTGKAGDKFGIDYDQAPEIYALASRLPGIEAVGLACHIGSQLTTLAPFRAAFERIAALTGALRDAALRVTRLDLGGGLGIGYEEPKPAAIREYVDLVRTIIAPLGCAIEIEPGRSIVGHTGILVARVISIKEGVSRNFLIVDAAMNDLIRPALYDAYHDILPVIQPASDAACERMDVVGPICESSDRFAEQRPLPPLKPGDLVAFATAGAYGAVMSSTYNTRLPAPEVMVKGADFAVIRPRPTYAALIGQDILPEWL